MGERPDIEALSEALKKVGSVVACDDPVYKALVETSTAMVQALGEEEPETLRTIRALQGT